MKELMMMHIKESVGKMLDSYTAAVLAIVISVNTLEIVGKVLAALLTIILIIRGCIHISKATIERRGAKIDEKIKHQELKNLKQKYKHLMED